VTELKTGKKKSKWFMRVKKALEERNVKEGIFNSPVEAVAERHRLGVQFSQFCFHCHLNLPRGTSADQLRLLQPFGVYPFLYRVAPAQSRFLFSFVLSNWRWIDGGKCKNHPRVCTTCQVHNSSLHVLFECSLFDMFRTQFFEETDIVFDFDALTNTCENVAKRVSRVGRSIFERIGVLFPADV
jgi:hypothetical protein